MCSGRKLVDARKYYQEARLNQKSVMLVVLFSLRIGHDTRDLF